MKGWPKLVEEVTSSDEILQLYRYHFSIRVQVSCDYTNSSKHQNLFGHDADQKSLLGFILFDLIWKEPFLHTARNFLLCKKAQQAFSNVSEQTGATYDVEVVVNWNPSDHFTSPAVKSKSVCTISDQKGPKHSAEHWTGHTWISICLPCPWSRYVNLIQSKCLCFKPKRSFNLISWRSSHGLHLKDFGIPSNICSV